MNTSISCRLLVAFVAGLGCAPAIPATSMSAIEAAQSRLLSLPAATDNTDFLTRATSTTISPLGGNAESAWTTGSPAYALGLGQGTASALAVSGPGDAQMSLFTLLSYMNAQQDGRAFRLADAGISLVLQNSIEPPAPVPLPGAAWLFLMGLLGLAGGRLAGPKRGPVANAAGGTAAGSSGRSAQPALAA